MDLGQVSLIDKGVWRIMRLFSQHGFPFTCYAVGKAVEHHPQVIQEMQRLGHEIASHNYRWVDYQKLDEETEREYIRLCIKAIQNASLDHKAPVGWYTGRISDRSRRLVWEEYKKLGLPLLYECDAYNDDLPYWVDMDGEGLLVIPYTLDQNDMKFCVPPGFGGPDAFYQYLKNAFDILYEEGQQGAPKMMSIGLHCRLVGKPGRAAALRDFLKYISQFPDVWVATREQIALHWRNVHPYKK
jgi:peptidoglycan/xylan/chitin deacetylase (PgdA/CDA1 family)